MPMPIQLVRKLAGVGVAGNVHDIAGRCAVPVVPSQRPVRPNKPLTLAPAAVLGGRSAWREALLWRASMADVLLWRRFAQRYSLTLFLLNVTVVIIAFPHLVAAYFLNVGTLEVQRATYRGDVVPEVAVENLRQAAAWNGTGARAHWALAKAYFLTSRYDAAIRTWSGYPWQGHDVAAAFVEIGNVYAIQGLWKEAADAWARVGVKVDAPRAEEFSRSGTIRIPAATFDYPQDGSAQVSDARAVTLLTRGSITTALYFASSGLYEITVHAQHSQPPPIELQVQIDSYVHFKDPLILSFDRGDDSWVERSIRVRLLRGVHHVSVTFINDLYAPPVDRNASIEAITIRRID
jgi:hypothetical protein